MALTVINTPTKERGTTQSNWVACHNPVVFKIQTDAQPNTRDSAENYTSVREVSGKAVFTLLSTLNAEWYAPFLKIELSGTLYNSIATIERYDPDNLEVYTNLPFNGDDSGQAVKYYDAYLIEVLPTIGLPLTHPWAGQKPETEALVQEIAPLDGVSVFDLQTQLQRDVNSNNDLKQPSFPNDLDAFTGFRLKYRESFIDSIGIVSSLKAIASYSDLSGFALLEVASTSGLQTGGYIQLSGFTEDKYNGAVIRIRQIISSTTIQIDVPYSPYVALSGYESLQTYDINLDRFQSDYIEEGSQYWAVNAKQALGSVFGSNLVEYLTSNQATLARWMTIFENRTVFPDKYEDFTVLVDTSIISQIAGDNVLAYRQKDVDKNGNIINTTIEVIASQGEGVYRMPTGGSPTVAVQNLVATIVVDGIQLTWDAIQDLPLFSNYEIWRSESPNVFATGAFFASSISTEFVDQNALINSGTTYYYAVRALGTFASKFSNEVSANYYAITFNTNWNNLLDGDFISEVSTSSGAVTWLFEDGTSFNTNSVLKASGLDGTSAFVAVANSQNVTEVRLEDDKIVGVARLNVGNLNGDLIIRNNPTLSSIELSVGTHSVSNLLISNTGVSSFDAFALNITHIGVGFLQLFDCPNITSVKSGQGVLRNVNATTNVPNLLTVDLSESQLLDCPVLLGFSGAPLNSVSFSNSNNVINNFLARSKQFTQLDFSNCEHIGVLDYRFNSQLTMVTHKNVPQTINSDYLGSNCDLSSLDISMFEVNGSVQVENNANMSSLSLGSGLLNIFLRFQSCNISSISLGSVNIDSLVSIDGQNNGGSFPTNDCLIQLDALSVSGTGTISLGGSNPAPSGAGLTAKTNLILKGWTVNTN